MGCTDCGRKGGCDSRKHGMFAAVDEALARLYPTRRWGDRDEGSAMGEGVSPQDAMDLAAAVAKRLGTLALYRPGSADEWCDYIYVLCLGRPPSIIEIREGLADARSAFTEGAEGGPGAHRDDDGTVEERYLRVALSALAPFAGVQEVAMSLRHDQGDIIITESARGGVFDPVLLPRFQSLVAALAEANIRHLDFGEILEPPAQFDHAEYPRLFGGQPVIANYLFYPQPPTTVSTVVISQDTFNSISA